MEIKTYRCDACKAVMKKGEGLRVIGGLYALMDHEAWGGILGKHLAEGEKPTPEDLCLLCFSRAIPRHQKRMLGELLLQNHSYGDPVNWDATHRTGVQTYKSSTHDDEDFKVKVLTPKLRGLIECKQ